MMPRPHGRRATADDLCETDFFTWTRRQAEHLREGRLDLADLANIIEEIESSGRSEASALRSADRLIAMHLLELMARPGRATASRRATIVRARVNVDDVLGQSPGLKSRRIELCSEAYVGARKEAAAETGLPLIRFPATPPLGVDEVEDEAHWPDPTP